MNLILSTVMFLQEGSSEGGGSMFGFLMPMVLIFAIMYFLIFRPQAKKQKQQKAMINEIKKGDKIVTAGGIYGTVVGVKEKEQTLIVEIDKNVKIEIGRSSVGTKRE